MLRAYDRDFRNEPPVTNLTVVVALSVNLSSVLDKLLGRLAERTCYQFLSASWTSTRVTMQVGFRDCLARSMFAAYNLHGRSEAGVPGDGIVEAITVLGSRTLDEIRCRTYCRTRNH